MGRRHNKMCGSFVAVLVKSHSLVVGMQPPKRDVEFNARNQFKALFLKSWLNQVSGNFSVLFLLTSQKRKYKTNIVQAIFPVVLVQYCKFLICALH